MSSASAACLERGLYLLHHPIVWVEWVKYQRNAEQRVTRMIRLRVRNRNCPDILLVSLNLMSENRLCADRSRDELSRDHYLRFLSPGVWAAGSLPP